MASLQTVQEIYTAFGNGDIPAILAQIDDDVEWEWEMMDHGLPWITPGRGKEVAARFFQTLAGFDFRHFEILSFLTGGNEIVAVVREELLYKPTGKTIRDIAIHHWTLNDEAKVSRFRHFADLHQHVMAHRGE